MNIFHITDSEQSAFWDGITTQADREKYKVTPRVMDDPDWQIGLGITEREQ